MLKVGDRVKIREDLIEVTGIGLWTDMLRMAGTEVEITEVRETKYGTRYSVDGSERSWIEDCFVVPAEILKPSCVYCGNNVETELISRKGIFTCIHCIKEMYEFINRTELEDIENDKRNC